MGLLRFLTREQTLAQTNWMSTTYSQHGCTQTGPARVYRERQGQCQCCQPFPVVTVCYNTWQKKMCIIKLLWRLSSLSEAYPRAQSPAQISTEKTPTYDLRSRDSVCRALKSKCFLCTVPSVACICYSSLHWADHKINTVHMLKKLRHKTNFYRNVRFNLYVTFI